MVYVSNLLDYINMTIASFIAIASYVHINCTYMHVELHFTFVAIEVTEATFYTYPYQLADQQEKSS